MCPLSTAENLTSNRQSLAVARLVTWPITFKYLSKYKAVYKVLTST